MKTLRIFLSFLVFTLFVPTATAQSGTLAASPTQCTIPAGQSTCSTQITWSTANTAIVCVWRSVPSTALWACSLSGSGNWPWIGLGTNTFELRSHNSNPSGTDAERTAATLLASTTVVGVSPPVLSGAISTNPTQCTIGSGQSSCTTQISWTSNYSPTTCVWATAPTLTLWACNPAGTGSWPWITIGTNTFELRAHNGNPNNTNADRLAGTLLDTKSVTGVSPVAPNAAQFISQSVPATMTAGQSYPVAVTLKNAGSDTWTTGSGYTLGSQNPQDNWTWGMNRVALPSNVVPNQEVTFNFNVTAPTQAGSYNFQWAMLQEGVTWIQTASANVIIQVNAMTTPPQSGTNLISNGGFESPYTASYEYPFYSGVPIPNWNWSGGVAIQRNGSAWGAASAPEGGQTAVLQGIASLSTTINFATAGQYSVSFFGAQRPYNGTPQNIVVRLNNVAVTTIVPTSIDFARYATVLSIPSSGSYALTLEGTNGNGDNSAFIDDVQVSSATASSQCDVVVSPGASITSALNSNATIVCLAAGQHNVTATVNVPSGKTLRGQSNNPTDSQIVGGIGTQRVIQPLSGSTLKLLTVKGAPGYLPEFGVFVGVASSTTNPVRIEQINVSKNLINLGVWYASNVSISDVILAEPGNPTSHASDPNLWITNSSAVTLSRVKMYGGGDPGFDSSGALSGDGELGVYDSSNVVLDAVESTDCKTSAIYFRGCADCVIRNSTITRARGWGLDMVESIANTSLGNSNLLIENTRVLNSGYSASVLKLVGGINVTYRNNTFVDNNVSAYNGEPPQGQCSGIHVIGTAGTLNTSGNQVIIGGLSQPSQERCQAQ